MSLIGAWFWVVPGALVSTSVTALNALSWPRARRVALDGPSVSILVPARDEEATIEASVTAALASAPAALEVVVCDDGSTDGTPAILHRLQQQYTRLRVIRGIGLPAGWVGKPHACHQLAQAARGDVLLFVDADTRLSTDGVGRVLALLEDYGAAVATAVPRQETGSWFEALCMPLLHLTYTSWLWLPLVWRSPDPRFLAANGQVLAVRREAYDAIGGFEAVRNEVVDDMAFCRQAKEHGRRVVFADGDAVARCRMYDGAGDLWRGFSKNLYEGLGSPLALAGFLALYLTAFVAPWGALTAGLAGVEGALWPGVVGVTATLVGRAVLAWRHGHAAWSALLQPLAVLVLVAIGLNSWSWSRREAIEWAGRTYASRAVRGGSDA